MGHEIGHAVARHGGEKLSQGYLQTFGSVAASFVPGTYGLSGLAFDAVSSAGMLHYSREQEYEADQLGMVFMAQAGYEPQAALSFWRKFGSGEGAGSGGFGQYLSSHPLGGKRLVELTGFMPEAERLYQAAPRKYGLGENLK
jgi:predicted Zn-dependent protease